VWFTFGTGIPGIVNTLIVMNLNFCFLSLVRKLNKKTITVHHSGQYAECNSHGDRIRFPDAMI
jgi:hypothetical protein